MRRQLFTAVLSLGLLTFTGLAQAQQCLPAVNSNRVYCYPPGEGPSPPQAQPQVLYAPGASAYGAPYVEAPPIAAIPVPIPIPIPVPRYGYYGNSGPGWRRPPPAYNYYKPWGRSPTYNYNKPWGPSPTYNYNKPWGPSPTYNYHRGFPPVQSPGRHHGGGKGYHHHR